MKCKDCKNCFLFGEICNGCNTEHCEIYTSYEEVARPSNNKILECLRNFHEEKVFN